MFGTSVSRGMDKAIIHTVFLCVCALAVTMTLFFPLHAFAASYDKTVTITTPTSMDGDTVAPSKGSKGIVVSKDTSANIVNTKITTIGAAGIKSDNSSKLVLDGVTVAATDPSVSYAHGVEVSGSANTALKTPSAIIKNTTITTEGGSSYGIMLNNASIAEVTLTNVSTMSNDLATAVRLFQASKMKISSSDLKTSGSKSYGIHISDSSSIEADNVAIAVSGSLAVGVYGLNSSTATLKNSTVETTGGASEGIYMYKGAYFKVSDSKVSTSGDASAGAMVYSNGKLDLSNSSIVTKGEKASYAVFLYDNSNLNASDSEMSTAGASAHALVAMSSSSADVTGGKISTAGNKAHGVLTQRSSSVNLTGTAVVTSGQLSHALYASQAGTSIDMTGGSINTTGDKSLAAYTVGGTVNIDGTAIKSEGSAFTFRADSNGVINVKDIAPDVKAGNGLMYTDTSGTLNAENSVLSGMVAHEANDAKIKKDGALNISLTNSYWTGNAELLSRDSTMAKININIDSQSMWNVNGESYTKGALNNAGLIDFSQVSEFNNVTVDSYNGTAESAILMKSGINDGDSLTIDGDAAGESLLAVIPVSPSGEERSKALVTVNGSNSAKFELTGYDGVRDGKAYVSAGAWNYTLENAITEESATEWFLNRSGISYVGEAIVEGGSVNDVWYTETNTLLNRMGIYRDNSWNGGFWVAAAVNKENFKPETGNFLPDSQSFKTGTVGYDIKKETKNGAAWYGIMAGYGKNDVSVTSGIGEVETKSFHTSLYGIYRHNNGMYVNGLIKYNKYSSDMSLADGGRNITGEWDRNGFGISVQTGKRFDFKNGGGWYWEPQVQLSWNRVFSENYTTSNGITVALDDTDYVRLRGGLTLGRQIALAEGRFVDLYGDVSVIHDFDGKTDTVMSGAKYTSDLGGTWASIGLGANYQYDSGKFAHIKFQYSDGTSYREPFTVYAGLSFETN